MHRLKKIRQLKFLITAGGTREYIDPVRFISNASSGKMGFELARAARAAGHKVTLITTIRNPEPQISNIKKVFVETSAQMFQTVKKYFTQCDCLIMAAAVSDYTPVKIHRLKIRKSSRPLALKLKPTPDILKWAGLHKRKDQLVVGFALEDRNLKTSASRKMKEKNLDMIVANTISAIGSDHSVVFVKSAGKRWLKLGRSPKSKIALRLLLLIQSLIPRSSFVNNDSNL